MTRVLATLTGLMCLLAPVAFAQVNPGGYTSYTFAGGGPPDGSGATSIALSDVYGIATDTAGNTYIPSVNQNRVFKVAVNGSVSTVAGNGTIGYSGDSGPAASAQLNRPQGAAIDGAGNLYIADTGNCRVRKVSSGVITTVAGAGTACFYSGDGGPATSATIRPNAIAVDNAGNLYISDGSTRILKVSGGVITTIAGSGVYGYSGDNGPATAAQISAFGIAVNSAGSNLYIADQENYRVRKVSAGVITTVAGHGSYGYSGDGGPATSAQIGAVQGVAVDASDNLYFSDSTSRIRKVSGGVITTVAGNGTYGFAGDGGPATSAQISTPYGLAVDSAGVNLSFADQGNYRVRKVSGGLINTIAGNGSYEYSGDHGAATAAQVYPGALAAGSAGTLYIADSRDYRIRKVAGGIIDTVVGNGTPGFSGDNGPATSAQISDNYGTSGLALDGSGNLYLTDSSYIRKVAGGTITTIAGNGTFPYSGDGGSAANAQLGQLGGIAADASGTVYLTDLSNNRIRKISGGVITLVAGGGPPDGSTATNVSIYGKSAVDSAGNVYVASLNRIFKVATNGSITTVAGTGVLGYSGDGVVATAAKISPGGIAVDSTGNLYFIDSCRIMKIVSGVLTTIAGDGGCSYSGDGGPATNASIYPSDIAVDIAGNIYLSQSGVCVIRRISAGVINTIAGSGTCGYSGDGGPATAAQMSYISGIAVDSSGNLYLADTSNYRIRKVSGGVITTVAGNGSYGYSGDGGLATGAQIAYPNGVAVDSANSLYFADSGNYRIRKVAGGVITTFAGTGNYGYSGDGGQAVNAAITYVQAVTVDSTGKLYIWDGNRIRKVSSGVISTIAGNGAYSYSGDGGPAVTAQVAPQAVAVDTSGNLYVSDSANARVRRISPGGTITTLAGGGTQSPGNGGLATDAALTNPGAIAADAAQNVYFVDRASTPVLRKVSSGGVISTIATITTTPIIGSLPFGGDAGLAVDSAGNVYLSDSINGRVRVVQPAPVLQIGKTHTANFTQGQLGATYTLTVLNSGTGPTFGTVAVTENLPAGLTLVSMGGTGWTCPGVTCTRSDALGSNSVYPPITVTVNVSSSAPALVTNQVTVSGGGSVDGSAIDPTNVVINLCPVTLNSPGALVAVSGGSGTAGVTIPPACQWTAVSQASWITVTSQTTAFGSGSFNYTAAANPNGTARAGTISVNGLPFTLTQNAAVMNSALRFVPVTPCRIADTRNPDGALGGPALGASSSRDFAVPASACGIPPAAVAYSLNMTVVPLGPLGFLSVWPAGQAQPVVSTLNSGDGRVKANAAIVPAGVNGAITVFASNPTQVIVDINGYFVPASGAQDLAFYPITPCRLADTRIGTGVLAGPALTAAVGRTFPVLSGSCGLPQSARAYAFNMTIVPPGPVGFLSAWPAGSSQPGSSTLNAPTGAITSNMAIVPAGTNGSITVIATNNTDLIIDVQGYFAAPGSPGALDFYTATPCRILDTRGPTGQFGGPAMAASQARSFAVPASGCNIPAAARAYSLNATVVPPAALGFLSLWGSGAQPGVSTLNSPDGSVVANAALVPAGTNGVVTAITTHITHLILDINGYFQ